MMIAGFALFFCWSVCKFSEVFNMGQELQVTMLVFGCKINGLGIAKGPRPALDVAHARGTQTCWPVVAKMSYTTSTVEQHCHVVSCIEFQSLHLRAGEAQLKHNHL